MVHLLMSNNVLLGNNFNYKTPTHFFYFRKLKTKMQNHINMIAMIWVKNIIL